MAVIVYVLCALTSLACAALLLRAYGQTKVRLLLWSGLCFVGLTLNNLMLIVDTQVVPEVDLAMFRALPAALGLLALLYGLIWDVPSSTP